MPTTEGRTYGTLDYDSKTDEWVLDCEPAACEFAKRLFPGVQTRKKSGLRFSATRRLTGELNWFLLRYPLRIVDRARYDAQHRAAVEHALRRGEVHATRARTPPPTFRGKLLHFQKKGLTFLLENERCVLAWQQGLGKTVAAIAGLATAEAFPVLWVTKPGILPTQLQEMLGEYLDLPQARTVRGRQATLAPEPAPTVDDHLARGEAMSHIVRGTKPYDLPDKPVIIIPYNLLASWVNALDGYGFKALVYDEIHELRHADTAKYSAAISLSAQARYVWGLSGTPIFNYGDEMWSVLNVVDFHCLADRESFTVEWCIGYGQKQVKDPRALGAYLREEGLLLREVKRDVQGEMPPKVRKIITVDHDDARFRALVDEARGVALGYDKLRWQEKGVATRKIETMVRKAAGEAKAPAVAAFTAGLLASGERVMLFAHHHDVHDILRDELAKYKPVLITGRETEAQKLEARAAFIRGDTNLAIVAIRGAAGLDGFQKRGTCVVFAELDWSPAQHEQDEDRLHRYGMDLSLPHVMAYYLVSRTGIDDTMQDALGLKKSQFVGIMGDEVETEREQLLAQRIADEHMDKVIASLKALAPAEAMA